MRHDGHLPWFDLGEHIPARVLLGMAIAGAVAMLSPPALDLTLRPLSEKKTDLDFGGGRRMAESCAVSPIRTPHDLRHKPAACGEA